MSITGRLSATFASLAGILGACADPFLVEAGPPVVYEPPLVVYDTGPTYLYDGWGYRDGWGYAPWPAYYPPRYYPYPPPGPYPRAGVVQRERHYGPPLRPQSASQSGRVGQPDVGVQRQRPSIDAPRDRPGYRQPRVVERAVPPQRDGGRVEGPRPRRLNDGRVFRRPNGQGGRGPWWRDDAS